MSDPASIARNFKLSPPGSTGEYSAQSRELLWGYVEIIMNHTAKNDTASAWYDGSGGTSMVGMQENSLDDHFNNTHGSDEHYDAARWMYTIAKNKITGGEQKVIDAIARAGGNVEEAEKLLTTATSAKALAGMTAGEIADTLYKALLAEKRKGDARWQLGAPPIGSDADAKGRWGDLLGSAGRRALAKLDECAEKVENGDYSGCKPGAAEEEKGAEGEDDLVRTLGFKEQCFLLSKVATLASYKSDPTGWNESKGKQWTRSISARGVSKRWPYCPSIFSDVGTNACIQVQSDPFSFINELAIHKDTQKFLTMPSEEIANLQPIIRFYKVIQSTNPLEGEIQIPIHFDTDAATDLFNFKRGSVRNLGVGIGDFQVKFQGTNPFAAKKDLTAKLTIFANNFSELVRPRYAGYKPGMRAPVDTVTKYQYVDLALKTDSVVTKNNLNAKNDKTSTNVVSGLDFTIRAIVGVNKPAATVGIGSWYEGALSRNFVTLEMIPTTHSFDFQDDGSVKFEINYKPFVNENFASTAYDVFSTKEITGFLLASDIIATNIVQNCDTKTAAEFKRSQVESIKGIQREALLSLLKEASDQGLMRYLWLPAKLLKEINRKGPLFDFEKIVKEKARIQTQKGIQLKTKIAQAASKTRDVAKETPIAPVAITPESAGVQFIYLSDLIDVILAGIDKRMNPDSISALINEIQSGIHKGVSFKAHNWESEETKALIQETKAAYAAEYKNFQKLRVVLGPIELVDAINPAQVKIVNLGDLPVSVKYLTEFFTEQVLKKGRRQFPLDQCIDKLINQMISSFLNNDSCFNGSVKQRTFLRRTSFVGHQSGPRTRPGMDPLTAQVATMTDKLHLRTRVISKTARSHPLIDVVGDVSSALAGASMETFMYSTFYTANTLPIDMFVGDRTFDTSRGVHHYSVGRDTGIIKEIKLVRDKRKGIAEARYAQDGFNGLTQLREMYHVEITTVANLSTYPGMKIFVDPSGWVPVIDSELKQALGSQANLTDFGIGGYYDIVEVEHFFGPGTFETKFTAKWTAQTSTTPTAASEVASQNVDEKKKKKCTIYSSGQPGGDAIEDEIPQARAKALEHSFQDSAFGETTDDAAPLPPPSHNPESTGNKGVEEWGSDYGRAGWEEEMENA